MVHDNDARACVEGWIERVVRGRPVDLQLQAFDEAFDALWRRAQMTLGDVTLMAIVDRVIYNATDRFPAMSALTVEPTGLQTKALRERGGGVRADELLEGIRFVLVEFLTVLGTLTAEILTRALYDELENAGQEKAKR